MLPFAVANQSCDVPSSCSGRGFSLSKLKEDNTLFTSVSLTCIRWILVGSDAAAISRTGSDMRRWLERGIASAVLGAVIRVCCLCSPSPSRKQLFRDSVSLRRLDPDASRLCPNLIDGPICLKHAAVTVWLLVDTSSASSSR